MAATKEKGADAAAKPAAAGPEDEAPRPRVRAMDMLLTDAGRRRVGHRALRAGQGAAQGRRPAGHCGPTAWPSAWAARRSSRPRSGPGARRSSRPRATAASRTTPGRGNPAFHRLQQLYLLWAPRGRRPDRRRRPGLEGRAPAALRRRQRDRRAGAHQLPGRQPGRAQGHAGPRRVEPGRGHQEAGPRHGQAAADPDHGGHLRVRARREHRRHPGRGGAAHRGVRADPVRAPHQPGARGAAAGGAADDQQVLHHRPGAGPQHGPAPAGPGPAGVLHLVAQPGRGAGRLGPGHLRRRGHRGAGRRPGHHRLGHRPPAGPVRRRDRDLGRGRPPGGQGRGRPRWPASRWACACWTTRRRATSAPAWTARWRRWPRPTRPGAATSRASRWPACSRGYGPTTWCGTTG